MTTKKNPTNSLITSIQRKAPTPPPEKPKTETAKPEIPLKPKRNLLHVGAYDEDLKLLRAASAYLNSVGIKTNDGRIIQAAIHLLKCDDRLIEAYQLVSKRDSRRKAD